VTNVIWDVPFGPDRARHREGAARQVAVDRNCRDAKWSAADRIRAEQLVVLAMVSTVTSARQTQIGFRLVF
jgi:hypothetical protein